MQSICARVNSQSGVFTILLYFQQNQFKSKSNKTAVDRRQLHGNVVTTARRFDTKRKLKTISFVTQHVITTHRLLYSRAINCVPNDVAMCTMRTIFLIISNSKTTIKGSPLSCKRSDGLHTCARGCRSLCSDSMPSFCMTAFHQARTSGHQWNSFYYFHLAFNPRDLYYRGYK